MAASKIERLVVSLQAAHHQASFERAHNQCGQFRGINIGANFSSSPPLFDDRLQTIKPRTESPPRSGSQLRIAIIGIDGRI
jgi:hypothetical protein